MRALLLPVLALASSFSVLAQDASPRAHRPGFINSTALLEVDGKILGVLRSFSGGNAVAEVVTDPSGVGGKRLGRIRYEPIVLEAGAAMAPEFWAILQQWPSVKPVAGAILIVDMDHNVLKRLDFANASVREIALPTLDAASKEAVAVRVTLSAESARMAQGSGKAQVGSDGKQKNWLASTYRLSVDGLNTTQVSRIEPLVFRQRTIIGGRAEDQRSRELELKKKAESGRAQGRQDGGMETSIPECGDLVLIAPETGADALQKWFESTVLQEKTDERNGKIELLSPDLKTVLFSITLRGLGVYRLAPDGGNPDTVRRLEARIYVESATFDPMK